MSMKGKKVVVSGAANGIGTAIFCKLLEEGAYPIGIDIEPFKGSELARKLADSRARFRTDCDFFQGDASNFSRMRKVYNLIKSTLGKLDGLVNNAGLLGGDKAHGGRTMKAWDKMMRSHDRTAFVLTELSYPLMVDGGSIVNIGSIDTRMVMPDAVMYIAAKALLWGVTIAYAVTLGNRNIRVNMVSPGNVNTERNKAQYTEVPDLIRGFEGKTPLQRSVEPAEVAKIVVFLLSEDSSAITGEDVVIDCGFTRASWDPSWTGVELSEVYQR